MDREQQHGESLVSVSDPFEIVALATSAGGLHALSQVLFGLPADFPVPIVGVQHLDPPRWILYWRWMRSRLPWPLW
jgi:two-component system chemotaxis response regulator CheB